MKTYTLEELKTAQAKGCRIEYKTEEGAEWKKAAPLVLAHALVPEYAYRIHPDDEWKARLPRLKEGARWHRDDFTNEMLEGGYRPLLDGEMLERCDENWIGGVLGWFSSYVGSDMPRHDGLTFSRTHRPVPTEFLHPDELAKQPEAAQAPDFGEPWHNEEGDFEIYRQDQNDAVAYAEGTKTRDRIIACVNALAGVPDPAEFVRQAKEMQRAKSIAWNGSCPFSEVTLTRPAELNAKEDLSNAMKTPQTDTPETDAAAYDVTYFSDMGCAITATDREQCDGGSHVDSDFARTLERRALAAEAMVKELETSKDAILKRAERIRIELVSVTKERDEARAALRLRPIAEAGPVPEGMVRVYAERYLNEEWLFAEKPCESDTHYTDIIYPPQ